MENHHEGTISLCMIVKDEEDTLGRCLESARGFVDEIVIVDTGSRDDTPAIAARYGARILHLPWRDDFSQARNESLKQAIGEWVLVLDADEELPPETAGSLRGLTCCSEAEAWTFTIISPCSSDRAGQRIKHPGLRMFKNRDAYFFEGRLHEQIRPSILRANPDAAIMHANAEIIHNGYSMGIELRKSKTLRNISILEQALAEKPDDPFPNYNLGLSYYALGELEKSSRYYEAARRLIDPRDGFAAALFRNYSICLEDLGNYEQALDLADEGLAYFPDYPDLYFIKGQLYCDLNMTEQAKANFLKCLRFKQTLPEYVTNEGVTGHLALNNLAEVCTREKNFEEAAAYLEQVLKIRPVYELFAQLCSLLQQKGLDGSGVAAYLEDGFGLDHPTIARLSFGMKQERILRLVLEALLAGDCDPSLAATQAGYAPDEARQVLENYALKVGLSREALRDVKSALYSGMATAGVCYLLGKACAGLGRADEAFMHFARAGMQEAGNELYAACALEQLASKCLQHLVRMLKLDDGNLEMRKELFRVTSMRHKAQRLQQDQLRRGYEEDSAAMPECVAETEAADGCGMNSAAAAENRRHSEAASSEGDSEDEAVNWVNSEAVNECVDDSAATESAVPEILTESKSGMQTERLSIVMPVWAGAEVTNKALQAIVACTDTPYEIIIIDNGSDNQCQAVIADFESQRRKLPE